MAFEDFNESSESYNDEITSTWVEALRVAEENGADLPDNF